MITLRRLWILVSFNVFSTIRPKTKKNLLLSSANTIFFCCKYVITVKMDVLVANAIKFLCKLICSQPALKRFLPFAALNCLLLQPWIPPLIGPELALFLHVWLTDIFINFNLTSIFVFIAWKIVPIFFRLRCFFGWFFWVIKWLCWLVHYSVAPLYAKKEARPDTCVNKFIIVAVWGWE